MSRAPRERFPTVAFLRELLAGVRPSPMQAGLALGTLLVGAEREGQHELAGVIRGSYGRVAGDDVTRPELERVLRQVEAATIELGGHWSQELYDLAGEVVQRLRNALAATDW